MAKNKEPEAPETIVKRPGGYNMEPIQSAEEEERKRTNEPIEIQH